MHASQVMVLRVSIRKAAFLPSALAACVALVIASSHPAGAQERERPPVLTSALCRSLADSAARAIGATYVFPEIADSVARVIRGRARQGAYDVATGEELATKLTADLRRLSGDRHLAVHYEPLSLRETRVDSAERLRRRAALIKELEATNWGLPEVRVMAGNVGYLALTATHAPSRAGELFASAMTFLARTDALILDLRANTGGDSDMPTLVLSYFYDEPVEILEVRHRDASKVEQSWTYAFVPGKSYRTKRPVYVLMSDSTFSAAEAIAYTLQSTKRATIVGERTKGGANSGEYFSLGHDLEIFIPSARGISPVTKTNWEGVGVIPDLPSKAQDALWVAHDAAVARIKELTEP